MTLLLQHNVDSLLNFEIKSRIIFYFTYIYIYFGLFYGESEESFIYHYRMTFKVPVVVLRKVRGKTHFAKCHQISVNFQGRGESFLKKVFSSFLIRKFHFNQKDGKLYYNCIIAQMFSLLLENVVYNSCQNIFVWSFFQFFTNKKNN